LIWTETIQIHSHIRACGQLRKDFIALSALPGRDNLIRNKRAMPMEDAP
jgi:hypothetical protein